MNNYFGKENMDKIVLIQTNICSTLYGWYKGEYQEIFRCPRELDDKDLNAFIDDNRYFLGFEPDEETNDLRNVPDKEFIGYYRMYFRGGWCGRWFPAKDDNTDLQLSERDKIGISNIVKYISREYPKGCDWIMQEDTKEKYPTWGENERYLLKPVRSERYKILVDTRYGNGDYPIRIYVYRQEETNMKR